MKIPILLTKFYIPEPRKDIVFRKRLFEKLNGGLDKKLTLISAPAGFGKSTLLSSWIETAGMEFSWLSIDAEDNDPTRFFSYIIELVQKERREEEIGLINALQSPQPPSLRSVISSMINSLAEITDEKILVLDDYHLLSSPEIHREFSFFLENLPRNYHFIISTREDPPFHLGHMRAHAEMSEIRAADLRFTKNETADFLNNFMSLQLSRQQIDSLDQKTEGWIAGLQLVALSMRNVDEIDEFIEKFTGSHRFVLDYLVEEVLEHQTEELRSFLLKSSILDRLCAPLCEAVIGLKNCQAILESIEKNNLFLTPLDDERKWYRYHHLFSDFLFHKLKASYHDEINLLYLKANDWCKSNKQLDKAVDYCLRAQEIDCAMDIIEQIIENIWQNGEHGKIARWMSVLFIKEIQKRPQLSIFYAWDLFTRGLQDEAEDFLRRIENSLDIGKEQPQTQTNKSKSNISTKQKKTFIGRAEMMRAYMASYRSDAVSIAKHGKRALENLPESDKNWINTAYLALSDAQIFSGDYRNAHQTQKEFINRVNPNENIYLFLNASMKHALVCRAMGKFDDAVQICRKSIRLADKHGLSQSEMAGWIYAVWGETLAEINNLKLANQMVQKGIALTELGKDVAMYSWCLQCFTRVMFSRNDEAMVKEAIKSTKELLDSAVIPRWVVNIIFVWQVRLWLKHGEIQSAAEYLLKSSVTSGKPYDYVDGIAQSSLVRVLIAQGRFNEALKLCRDLYRQAEKGNHIERMLITTNLKTLALSSMGDEKNALSTLGEALSMGCQYGYCRIFIDEGPQMESLLRKYRSGNDQLQQFSSHLLSVFSNDRKTPNGNGQSLLEPLSDRELQLLILIAAGLTNRQIAEKLFLSKNTVKSHTRNIYQKLGVNNRTQAVTEARSLKIIPSD